jgi:hypothetical protein
MATHEFSGAQQQQQPQQQGSDVSYFPSSRDATQVQLQRNWNGRASSGNTQEHQHPHLQPGAQQLPNMYQQQQSQQSAPASSVVDLASSISNGNNVPTFSSANAVLQLEKNGQQPQPHPQQSSLIREGTPLLSPNQKRQKMEHHQSNTIAGGSSSNNHNHSNATDDIHSNQVITAAQTKEDSGIGTISTGNSQSMAEIRCLTVKELKEELRHLGHKVGGVKEELVERLYRLR